MVYTGVIGSQSPNEGLSLLAESGGAMRGRSPEGGRPACMLFLPMLPPPSGLHPRAGAVAAYAARLLCNPFPWAYAHGYLLPPHSRLSRRPDHAAYVQPGNVIALAGAWLLLTAFAAAAFAAQLPYERFSMG